MAVVEDDFGADERFDAGFAGGFPEAGGAGEGVAVDQGDGGQAELDRSVNEVFGLRGAFEEGEGRGAVELGVLHRSVVRCGVAAVASAKTPRREGIAREGIAASQLNHGGTEAHRGAQRHRIGFGPSHIAGLDADFADDTDPSHLI